MNKKDRDNADRIRSFVFEISDRGYDEHSFRNGVILGMYAAMKLIEGDEENFLRWENYFLKEKGD